MARAVLHDPVDQRLELGELIDVVAVRLRLALDRGLAVGVDLQPHHLRLGARTKVQPGVLGELRVDAFQVAAAVRREERAPVDLFLATAEQRAPHAGGLRIPGQDVEGLGLGRPDELARFGAVADVVAVAVGEQVGGGPVHELEARIGDPFPVGGGDALAHDATGHGDELVVHVLDALVHDLTLHGLDGLLHDLAATRTLRDRVTLPPPTAHEAQASPDPRTGVRAPIVRATISTR